MKNHTLKLILMTVMCVVLCVASLPFCASAEGASESATAATDPTSATTASNAAVSVGSASGKAGDTVTVNVDLTQNPGVIAMTLDVNYDEKQLELVSASNSGVLSGYNSSSSYGGGSYRLNWNDPLSSTNNTNTGTVATLTFKLKEDCDKASVNVSGKGYDTNVNSVSVSGAKGTITNTTPTTTTTTTKPTTTKPTTTKPSTTKPTTTKRTTTTSAFTRGYNEQNTYPVDFIDPTVTEEESTTDLIALWETTEFSFTEAMTEELTTEAETQEEQKGSFLAKLKEMSGTKILLIALMVCFLIVGIAIIISMVRKSKG